jgi:hypothetical protein
MADQPNSGRTGSRAWYLLLLIPFVGLLWPPFYAKDAPRLAGFPFFYWYQFLWVLIGAAVTAVVYWATTTSGERHRAAGEDSGRLADDGGVR